MCHWWTDLQWSAETDEMRSFKERTVRPLLNEWALTVSLKDFQGKGRGSKKRIKNRQPSLNRGTWLSIAKGLWVKRSQNERVLFLRHYDITIGLTRKFSICILYGSPWCDCYTPCLVVDSLMSANLITSSNHRILLISLSIFFAGRCLSSFFLQEDQFLCLNPSLPFVHEKYMRTHFLVCQHMTHGFSWTFCHAN